MHCLSSEIPQIFLIVVSALESVLIMQVEVEGESWIITFVGKASVRVKNAIIVGHLHVLKTNSIEFVYWFTYIVQGKHSYVEWHFLSGFQKKYLKLPVAQRSYSIKQNYHITKSRKNNILINRHLVNDYSNAHLSQKLKLYKIILYIYLLSL